MLKKYIPLLGLALCAVGLVLPSCKTNEKNYREAYERATAQNDRGVTDFENTIYNRYRSQTREDRVQLGDRTVDTKIIRVKVTEDGGGIPEWLHTYSVVVGEFKQRFNALSLCRRYTDAGYPRAFLVENAEPYYYIVVGSSDNLADMVALRDSIAATSPLPLKEGFPYILQRP